jgi:hypothetical protein
METFLINNFRRVTVYCLLLLSLSEKNVTMNILGKNCEDLNWIGPGKISGSHGREHEDGSLLGSCIV